MGLLRRTISNDVQIEERILTGMVVSTSYLKEVQRLISKTDIFQVPYVVTVGRWCLDFLRKYGEAPLGNIQDIFRIEKANIREEEKSLIGAFLDKLSKQYEQEGDNFNVDYLLDQTINYLKKRNLKQTSEIVLSLVELGRIGEAEKEFENYKKVAKVTSNWINPFSNDEINNYFSRENDDTNILMTFPGAIGKMIGPFERGALLGILAPTKRGKTWWLQEIAVRALMEKYKVAFFSLEMSAQRIKRRLYKRMIAMEEAAGDYVYPVFDCYFNQNGTCTKKEKVKTPISLLGDDGKKPNYDARSKYLPCSICRGTKDYKVATWKTTIRRPATSRRKMLRLSESVKATFGDNLRIKCYPSFSANINHLKEDLALLFYTEGFMPDFVVVDYFDILAPEDKRITGRERIDETWKMGKNLADTQNCFVATASQSNRTSFNKDFVTQVDTSEDIRKIANSDIFLAINQNPKEKTDGVVRISKIADREGDFDQFVSCLVLQQLQLGQPLLDSEFIDTSDYYNQKEKK